MAAQVICNRSIWQTLVAAASTCAIFLAANWSSKVVKDVNNWKRKIQKLILMGMVDPLSFLFSSMSNAMYVWVVKRSLDEPNMMDHEWIAIITLCRIFIEAPKAAAVAESTFRAYGPRDWVQVESSRPLELQPRPDAVEDVETARTNSAAPPRAASDHDEWITWELTDLDEFTSVSERAALLSVHLAPNDELLRLLRPARSNFQTVVTFLQAGGYLLSIIQRVVQRLAISPEEGLAFLFSIIVVLQLLIELYTCGSYERRTPLRIRLQAHQLERLRDAPRKDLFQGNRKQFMFFGTSMVMLWLLIICSTCICYFSLYVHIHLISAISALLYFLAQVPLVLSKIFEYPATIFSRLNIYTALVTYYSLGLLLLCNLVLIACSMIVAVVGTIVEWHAFHNQSHNWFAWIIPHLSS